jgi:hypothetical protein
MASREIRGPAEPAGAGSFIPRSAGIPGLEEEPAAGGEAQDDPAAGLSPVKTTLGQENMDTGPDTALAAVGRQCLHDVADMTALAVGNSPEDIDLEFRWHKNFRGFVGDLFHGFHSGILVNDCEKSQIARQVWRCQANHHQYIGRPT